jgi:excisionase family DNA binding protein
MTQMTPDWINTQQAADCLGITLRTLYRLIDEKGIPAYRFGRVIRLKQSELTDWVEAARVKPGELKHLNRPIEKEGV